LPAKWRPLEGPRCALNCFREIAAAVGRCGETHFVFDADSARQRLFISRGEHPGDSRGQKDEPHETKNPGDHTTGTQLGGPPQGQAKQENPGKGGAHAMPGDVHDPVEGKEERSDQGRHPKALVRSLLQWKNAPDEEAKAHQRQRDPRPAGFHPEPKPVALGMNGPGVRE
jgi:hypothetical protein